MTETTIVSTAWHSPQSIYNLGHRAIADLFTVPVQVQEKIDGSFFAFGLFPELDRGEGPLRIRSKGAVMNPVAPEGMFQKAVDTVDELVPFLKPGWQYRGEYLRSAKHNSLAYDRHPRKHIILFDICTDEETYLTWDEMAFEAQRLELEVVPQLAVYDANACTHDSLRALLEHTSILGGQEIEGVVVKPLVPLWGVDKKLLMGKFVSEAFKEVHSKAWKESNPGPTDILNRLADRYNTPARWAKAVQHLREAGQLEDSPRDIGKILKEIPLDVEKECKEEIMEALFGWAWPAIRRGVTAGFPQYYKEMLLKRQFEEDGNGSTQAEVQEGRG